MTVASTGTLGLCIKHSVVDDEASTSTQDICTKTSVVDDMASSGTLCGGRRSTHRYCLVGEVASTDALWPYLGDSLEVRSVRLGRLNEGAQVEIESKV
jgi:hypothetical protein